MRMNRKGIFYLVAIISSLSLFVLACKNRDQQLPDENLVDHIYFDYKITGEEGYDNLTILLKFREEDKVGEAFTPPVLKTLLLDGAELVPDSSKMNGTYYEIQRPIGSFAGTHTISFITVNDQEYTEEIRFAPVVLTTEIPEDLPREDLVLNFTGLEDVDRIRIVMTDTSFFNDGINRIDTVFNNQLILTKEDFSQLADGPILLEFIREYERPLNESATAGGRLRINYTLRRTFNLQ